jgi:hypothetical protein
MPIVTIDSMATITNIFRFLRYTLTSLLETIILGQEIGSVPIDDISLGFFFRMDIEFIEDHHLLVL